MSLMEHRKRLRALTWITVGLAVVAVVSGALGGCSSETAGSIPTPTRTPAPAATLSPTDIPLPPPTSTPEFTPTPTPLPENVNPLTGEVVSDPSLLERVPVATKIVNYPPEYVWPQAGLNSADLIFEHYNEGWFSSRWTAVYLGKDPQQVGPIRSGRIIDLEIPAMYKAVFACSGFSNGVLALFRDSDLYPDWVASESLPDTLSPSPFYRDSSRDVPLEHTMFTSPALVRAWAEEHGISGRQNLEGMGFSEKPKVEGEPATYIYIPWHLLDAEWRYDEASGRYLRWSDGVPHTDALNGQQLSVANVVLLYVAQWDTDIVEDPHWGNLSIRWALWSVDNPYRPAILFRDGVRIDGIWHREERGDMLTLTDEDGHLIPLKVGNTFFEVVPIGEHKVEITVEP